MGEGRADHVCTIFGWQLGPRGTKRSIRFDGESIIFCASDTVTRGVWEWRGCAFDVLVDWFGLCRCCGCVPLAIGYSLPCYVGGVVVPVMVVNDAVVFAASLIVVTVVVLVIVGYPRGHCDRSNS